MRGADYKESRASGKLARRAAQPRRRSTGEPPIPATVLAINSQVAYGHVGNSAAAFALQRLGHEVWPVPTVLYSHHPGHGAPRGTALSAGLIRDLLAGLAERDVFEGLDAILTGYFRDPESVEAAADAVARTAALRPAAVFCCDPVMGDRHTGLYVPEAVAAALRSRLVPKADIVTPNAFELERLAGLPVAGLDDALTAAARVQALGPRIVVCTSLEGAGGDGSVAALAVSGPSAWLVRASWLAQAPHGAGDLFAALFLGSYLESRRIPVALGQAISATHAVLSASVAGGADELLLIEAQDELVAPGRLFTPERIR